MSSNPSSEPSSGRQDDGVVALGSAYRFFGAAPAWVLSGIGLAVVLVQAMWLTGWKLDLAMRVIQLADRSTLLIMAVYQVAFFEGFILLLGYPGWYVWKSVGRIRENNGGGLFKDFLVTFLSSATIDIVLFFVVPWILFVLGLVSQFVILVAHGKCLYKVHKEKNMEDWINRLEGGWSGGKRGRPNCSQGVDIKYGVVLNLLSKSFAQNSNVITVAVIAAIIAAIFVPGSWFPSQKITYQNNDRGIYGTFVGEVLGENEGGVVVLRDGEMDILKKGDVIKEEFCGRIPWSVIDNDTLFVKINGSGVPDCSVM
jgi:hypothetical protein